jgi:hypothetical protein
MLCPTREACKNTIKRKIFSSALKAKAALEHKVHPTQVNL